MAKVHLYCLTGPLCGTEASAAVNWKDGRPELNQIRHIILYHSVAFLFARTASAQMACATWRQLLLLESIPGATPGT